MTSNEPNSFVSSLDGSDVPLEDRRFLLVPISGCAIMPEDGMDLHLEPMPLIAFSEGEGWEKADARILEGLDLGKSMPTFDGIAQAQSIIRVV